MNIDFEKLRNVCSEILPIDSHIFCSHKEKKMEECTEANCPLKLNDVSVVMANDAVRNMHIVKAVDIVSTTTHGNADHLYEGMTCATGTHIVTDNSETLKNALARIAMLEKKIKSYYCNCDIREIRIDQVPTCECCNRPIFMEEG